MQKIIVLGASGTIGQNTIDIIRKFPSRFELAGVSVHTKTDVLNALRAEFHFQDFAVTDSAAAAGYDIKHHRKTLAIQRFANRVMEETGTDFVVITDETFTRYSHPIEDFVGKKFSNIEDISSTFQSGDHYSKQSGVLGDGLRFFTAIKDETEKQLIFDQDIIVKGVNGKIIKAKTTNLKKLVKESEKKDMVFAIGPAGTGKTYTSVALAVRALKNKQVKRIILTRPAVEAGENLGFLPGDLKEKVDPYLRPIYDALLHEGVIVRPIAGYGMPNHLRISIGLPEENSRLFETLRKVLNLQ